MYQSFLINSLFTHSTSGYYCFFKSYKKTYILKKLILKNIISRFKIYSAEIFSLISFQGGPLFGVGIFYKQIARFGGLVHNKKRYSREYLLIFDKKLISCVGHTNVTISSFTSFFKSYFFIEILDIFFTLNCD